MTGRDSGGARDRVLLQLERPSPRLPRRSLSVPSRVAVAGLVHVVIGVLLLALPSPSPPDPSSETAEGREASPTRLVFVAPPDAPRGGGGGGGGNERPGPVRQARMPGRDLVTVPAARPRSPELTAPPSQADQQLALDARPLASGQTYIAGLPDAGTAQAASDIRGSGTGSGFGEGQGSGIGSGDGPGVGAGTGGGTGGGTYRPGGAVSAPVLLTQVRPRYTEDAMHLRIQGAVTLELVVRRNGVPDAIRVVDSLDRGLDEEAIAAVRQWRFQPGRLGDVPVDVLVSVVVNFHLY